jgi:hypothetical protein
LAIRRTEFSTDLSPQANSSRAVVIACCSAGQPVYLYEVSADFFDFDKPDD